MAKWVKKKETFCYGGPGAFVVFVLPKLLVPNLGVSEVNKAISRSPGGPCWAALLYHRVCYMSARAEEQMGFVFFGFQRDLCRVFTGFHGGFLVVSWGLPVLLFILFSRYVMRLHILFMIVFKVQYTDEMGDTSELLFGSTVGVSRCKYLEVTVLDMTLKLTYNLCNLSFK